MGSSSTKVAKQEPQEKDFWGVHPPNYEYTQEEITQIQSLSEACSKNDLETIKSYISQGKDKLSDSGVNPLHLCAQNPKILNYLLSLKKFDVNAAVKYVNTTPLHYSAFNDNSDSIRLLLDAGADPEKRDFQFSTPYQTAKETQSYHAMGELNLELKKRGKATPEMGSWRSVCRNEILNFSKYDELMQNALHNKSEKASIDRIAKSLEAAKNSLGGCISYNFCKVETDELNLKCAGAHTQDCTDAQGIYFKCLEKTKFRFE